MKRPPYEHAARAALKILLDHQIGEVGRILSAGTPAGHGFALFFFEWDEGRPIAYVSNGAREDVLRMMQEWIGQTRDQQRSQS